MHITRKKVILKLMYAERLRYSELLPDGMTGNQFKYHLDGLLSDGFIEKDESGYSLTGYGKNYIEQVSQRTGSRTKQPKLVAQVAITNPEGHYIFHRQERQPFRQTWNLPYGKVHFDEHPTDTVRRICKRFGIADFDMEQAMTAHVLFEQSGDIVSSQLRVIFSVTNIKQELAHIKGKTKFIKRSEYSDNSMTPGVLEIIETLEKEDPNNYIELALTD